MEKKLENALIRTYRKLRDSPDMKGPEIAGLFINFYYSESGSHSGLFSNDFTVLRDPILDILVISPCMQWSHHKGALYTQLLSDFGELTSSDYYSLWLRSSWEDPKEEQYGNEIVRKSLNGYHSFRNDVVVSESIQSNVSREAKETEAERIGNQRMRDYNHFQSSKPEDHQDCNHKFLY